MKACFQECVLASFCICEAYVTERPLGLEVTGQVVRLCKGLKQRKVSYTYPQLEKGLWILLSIMLQGCLNNK